MENLARHVGKEEKFSMVIIISAFYGTDIQNSQHKGSFRLLLDYGLPDFGTDIPSSQYKE